MATLINTATITYNLLGVSLSVNSNPVNFEVVVNVVTLTKSVAPSAGKSGDTVTFTINALAAAAITSAVITDTIPVGLTFIAGTVKVDGTTQPAASPATGINLGGIGLGITKVVTFQCTVN